MDKKLSSISRTDWICFHWMEKTSMGDEDRIFEQSYRRTPDEAAHAMEEWDITADEREALSDIS